MPSEYKRLDTPAGCPSLRDRFTVGVADSQYSAEEVEFMMAVDRYKRANHRPYPTFAEVLGVLKMLGYKKCAQ